jgi:hypothetical protein
MSIEPKERPEKLCRRRQLSLALSIPVTNNYPEMCANLDITRTTSECAVIRPQSRIRPAESSMTRWQLLVMYFPQCHRGTLPS